jgi:hypothetical protein
MEAEIVADDGGDNASGDYHDVVTPMTDRASRVRTRRRTSEAKVADSEKAHSIIIERPFTNHFEKFQG